MTPARSLRFRLLMSTSIGIVLLLSMLSAAIYFVFRQMLISQFDDVSLAQIQAIMVTAEQKSDRVKFEFDPRQIPEYARGSQSPLYQAWDQSGTSVLRSQSLGDRDLPKLFPPDKLINSAPLPDGAAGRLSYVRFLPHVDLDESDPGTVARPIWICVARATAPLDDALAQVRFWLFTLCGLAVVLTEAILWFAVNRGMLPARRVAREIQTLDTDLSKRIDPAGVPAEMLAIVSRLNDLLDRLEQNFNRERAFTADAAHELRTPLAAMRTTLQVSRSRQRQPAEYQSAIDTSLSTVGHMQHMVENLLTLARADAGQLPLRISDVDLLEVVQEILAGYTATICNRQLRVIVEIPPIQLHTDPDKLRMILTNLIDNAASYTNTGGDIQISASTHDDKLDIRLTNTGSRIPPADVPILTKRFFRGDTSRSDADRHAGLGLSLCQRLANLLGGSLQLQSDNGQFVVTLQFAGMRANMLLPLQSQAG